MNKLQKHIKFIILIVLITLFSLISFANNDLLLENFKDIYIEELVFENRTVKDIFQGISSIADVTIIVDDNVKDIKTYYFRKTNINIIFNTILNDNNLDYTIKNSIIYIYTKNNFVISVDKDDIINLNANSASIQKILQEIFNKLDKVIILKEINDKKISINLQDYYLEEIIDIFSNQYNLEFKKIKNGYIVQEKNIKSDLKTQDMHVKGLKLDKNGKLYSIAAKKVDIVSILEQLFYYEKKDYSLLIDKKIIVDNLNLSNKTFEDVINILKYNYKISIIEDEYLYTVYQKEYNINTIDKKTSLHYILKNISVKDLKNVLPEEISLLKNIKFNEKMNIIYLYGFPYDIIEILDFIKKIDLSNSSDHFYYYLKNISVKKLKDKLPEKYKNREMVIIESYNSLIINLSKNEKNEFDKFINLVDKKTIVERINLYNIKADFLFNSLPDNLKKIVIGKNLEENYLIAKSTYPGILSLLKFIRKVDFPQKQLKYRILVLQVRDGNEKKFNPDINGDIDILDHSFLDVIKNFINSPTYNSFLPFGEYFSFKLNWAISNNIAKVSADSYIYSLNNNEVEFNNSSVFRYKEQSYDEETKQWVDIGVIREIKTGISFTIHGSAKGNEVLIKLNGKISRLNNSSDIGAESNILPMTSEKEIKTKFRAINKKPILAISFKEEYSDRSISKTPILGYIPLLGRLFTKEVIKKEVIDFYIYVLPEVIGVEESKNYIEEIYSDL